MRREDERIDYDELARLAEEHKPKMIIAGGSAYPRIIDFARFRQIADSVGAIFLVDMAHFSGLVAAGVHPNPCEYADIVTSTTHKTLRGPRSGMILCKEKFGAAIDKAVFPGMQGGPLVHIIAAKAVCFREALTPGVRRLSEASDRQRARRLRQACSEAGLPRRFRRHRYAPDAGGCVRERRARQGSRSGARPRPHHRQQERDSVRRQSAAESERHAPRQPRGDHARLPRSGDARSGRADRRVLETIGSAERYRSRSVAA